MQVGLRVEEGEEGNHLVEGHQIPVDDLLGHEVALSYDEIVEGLAAEDLAVKLRWDASSQVVVLKVVYEFQAGRVELELVEEVQLAVRSLLGELDEGERFSGLLGLLCRASGRCACVKRRLLDALDDHDEIIQSSVVLFEEVLGNASRRVLALVGVQRVLL